MFYIFEWNGNWLNNSFFFYFKNLNNFFERKIVFKEDVDYCKIKIEFWYLLFVNKLILNNCKINIKYIYSVLFIWLVILYLLI